MRLRQKEKESLIGGQRKKNRRIEKGRERRERERLKRRKEKKGKRRRFQR